MADIGQNRELWRSKGEALVQQWDIGKAKKKAKYDKIQILAS